MNKKLQDIDRKIQEIEDACDSYDHCDGWIFDRQKFLKMIVKECADIAYRSGMVNNKGAVAKEEAARIYRKINETFGID